MIENQPSKFRFDHFTNELQIAASRSAEIMTNFGHGVITVEHFLLSYLETEETFFTRILKLLQVDGEILRQKLVSQIESMTELQGSSRTDEIQVSRQFKLIIDRAVQEAFVLQNQYISSEHIVLATLSDNSTQAARILRESGITEDRIHKIIGELQTSAFRKISIFLCHSSGDKKEVRALRDRLTSNNIDPWLDEEKLLPGQDWQQEITKAVRKSDVVLVCLSNNSIRKSGFVQKEIRFALDIADEKPEGDIYIIPVKLEECQVPERLSRWQWVNLYERDGFSKLLNTLYAILSRQLS